MKNNALVMSAKKTFYKVSNQVQKHSPEILVVAGIVGVVTSAVMACKATTKINAILDNSKQQIDLIHDHLNDPDTAREFKELTGEEYTEQMHKKDLALTYAKTGFELVKLYAPSVILGGLSITSILASNNIMRKRNVALAAAYATSKKTFEDYRKRAVDRFGEIVDKELYYGIKAQKVEETVTDEETGKKKKVKSTVGVIDPNETGEYAFFFEEYTRDEEGNPRKNINWERHNEFNLAFLKAQQSYWNDMLQIRRRVFLNDVLKDLDLPLTKAGQIVGWVYDPENPNLHNFIDFGIYKSNQNYSDFLYGNDPAILLDFNVDGNIWELM